MATLFHDVRTCCDSLLFKYSLMASEEFINCADKQLTEQFVKITGIKPGKEVSMALTSLDSDVPIYSSYRLPNSNYYGRKLCLAIFIRHNWNPVTILWKSKSGRDYKLHDNDIDCNDIEFWFERLEPELYLKQLHPN